MEASPAQLSGAELLAWRRGQLAYGGASADLDWLLDLAGGVGWQRLQALRLHPDQAVPLRRPLVELEQLWQRHLGDQVPLQYLVGLCPWRDLELSVAPGVLIPRAETELLVELATQCCSAAHPRRWADLGTGSGCLAVGLGRLWPDSRGVAVDLSPEALAQAGANLAAHGLSSRVECRQGSWWQPLADQAGTLALVVANPPYIPTEVWRELEPAVREHEPALALDGGADGLDAIRAIAAGAGRHLAPGGWLLLEHHHDQSPAVLGLLEQAGLVEVHAHPDLEGKLRFAAARAAPITMSAAASTSSAPTAGPELLGAPALAERLKAGSAALFPTDTLPALAAAPDHAGQIWQLKQRPADKPLILMAAELDQFRDALGQPWQTEWLMVAEQVWPGAVTLVLPASSPWAEALHPGGGSLGLRIPACDQARELLRCSGPLATTSANRSGDPAATTAAEAARLFPSIPQLTPVPWPAAGGTASTVLAWCSDGWRVLRPGGILPPGLHLVNGWRR